MAGADDPDAQRDPTSAGDGDAWFLRQPPEDAAWDMPGPRAELRPDGPRAEAWIAAQARCAVPLARAAAAFGALDEALRQGGAGLRRRVVLMEVAELSWHLGDRVPVDRLGLYLAARLSTAADDARALMRAGWAVRRLSGGGQGPLGSGDAAAAGALADFLGRRIGGDPAADADPAGSPRGEEFRLLSEDWARAVLEAEALHPAARACFARAAWEAADVSGDDTGLEGAVVAARLGADGARGGATFLPVALGGPGAFEGRGDAQERLEAWLASVERACLRALMEADRLSAWTARAREAIGDLSGRTPPRIIAALSAWPLASAPMLEAETGASRAAVQRNMKTFEERGLVHEVTGQERFRFWRARL